ncbi:MAG: helix-turn-helix domain-containing protein [Nitrospinae bacterium]|nr:helix-turn-helix domain-containing protein [Nitrospinota bacterium]
MESIEKEINSISEKLDNIYKLLDTVILNNKTILSRQEACKYMGVCWNTLKKLVNEGEILTTNIGDRIFFSKETLDNFIRQKELKVRAFVKNLKS